MADLVTSNPPTQDPQAIYDIYRAHNSGLRIHTDTTIQPALLSHYPSHTLTSTRCDLIAYADAGFARAALNEDLHPNLRSWTYEPAARQPLDGSAPGKLKQEILFGRYDYVWQDHRFQVFVVDEQNSTMVQCDRRCYVLHHQPNSHVGEGDREGKGEMPAEALLLAASIWAQESHDQVWVYDQGRWSKDKELWQMVQGAEWEDLILDEDTKRAIIRDVMGFFDARQTYMELGTPWKRGLIFHGSPGNGKTSTAKALMKALTARPQPVSTLVVKTLAQRGFGPQMSVRQIFTKARQTAPCLLLFEDIDSLVTEQVRSYFFNEVDGLENNEGILMIGSTNDLDRLDPGLSKRPSRFDRKYRFNNPSLEERVRYCEYWRTKLSHRPASAPPLIVPPRDIATITDGFSFAYMKEAFVASLLTLIQDSTTDGGFTTPGEEKEKEDGEEEDRREWGRFGNVLRRQIGALRGDMADE